MNNMIGKIIAEFMRDLEEDFRSKMGIPPELMPSGKVSSAPAAEMQLEAKRKQLGIEPPQPTERELIQQRFDVIKYEVKQDLVTRLCVALKGRINHVK